MQFRPLPESPWPTLVRQKGLSALRPISARAVGKKARRYLDNMTHLLFFEWSIEICINSTTHEWSMASRNQISCERLFTLSQSFHGRKFLNWRYRSNNTGRIQIICVKFYFFACVKCSINLCVSVFNLKKIAQKMQVCANVSIFVTFDLSLLRSADELMMLLSSYVHLWLFHTFAPCEWWIIFN
jgi:hypothetical protein